MANILLIDVDSKKGYPNLALMKISAWYKSQGDTVYLNKACNPDKVYISCIFNKNRSKALGIAKLYPYAHEIFIGGSGVNYDKLPEYIEHIMPDYSLYNTDYSLGFLTRGCIRNCPFCIVPQKEGKFHENADIYEFLHPDHEKVVLMDNNLTASSFIDDHLDGLIDRDLKVSFNQGLDLRLITDKIAKKLSDIHYYDVKFHHKTIYFAWDLMNYEANVRNGLNILIQYIPNSSIFVYILVGYNTTFEEDMHRYKVLWEEYQVYPYVQLYNNTKNNLLRAFARWINKRIHKVCSWEDYKEARKK